jgi:hypothetical protein
MCTGREQKLDCHYSDVATVISSYLAQQCLSHLKKIHSVTATETSHITLFLTPLYLF